MVRGHGLQSGRTKGQRSAITLQDHVFKNIYFHECIFLGTFSFADKILSSIDACIYSNCICQRCLVHVHTQRKLLIQFLVTLYLNDFSGTSSANYANTQNVKRAEETQG